MSSVDPDELDRLLGRIDLALATLAADGALEIGEEQFSVELVVESSERAESWFVQLDRRGGRAGRGSPDQPTVVVRIDAATFLALRSGTLDMQRAVDSGRLTVRGDLGALARARPALRALAAALAATDTAAGTGTTD